MTNLLKIFASLYIQIIFVNSYYLKDARICIKSRNLRYHSLTRIKLSDDISALKQINNLNQAVNVFFTSGKNRIKLSALELSQFEQLLLKATKPLDIISFSKCLYALKVYKFNEVKNILPILESQCSKLKQPFGRQAVGNTLYGLQNMNSDSSEVRSVLRELSKKIAECTEPLDAQEVSNALYGICLLYTSPSPRD